MFSLFSLKFELKLKNFEPFFLETGQLFEVIYMSLGSGLKMLQFDISLHSDR